MIYYFYGDDDFEISKITKQIRKDFSGRLVVLDSLASANEVQSHIQSLSLFNENRLVILNNVSENAENWRLLEKLLETIPDSLTLMVVEIKPDKRSVTHKKLIKIASTKELLKPIGRLDNLIISWTLDLAKSKNIELDNPTAKEIILRANFNKWSIGSALDKIWLMQQSNLEINLDDVLLSEEQENIFMLFEATINHDQSKLANMIENISKTEDPYKVLGLLGSQFFNLVAVSASQKSASDIAKELGTSPYVLSKLKSHTKKINKKTLRIMAEMFVDADTRIKSTSINPWLVISQMLLKINRTLN